MKHYQFILEFVFVSLFSFVLRLARPKDPKVIQYLIEITDILRDVHSHDESDDDPEIISEMIFTTLNMNEQQLLNVIVSLQLLQLDK